MVLEYYPLRQVPDFSLQLHYPLQQLVSFLVLVRYFLVVKLLDSDAQLILADQDLVELCLFLLNPALLQVNTQLCFVVNGVPLQGQLVDADCDPIIGLQGLSAARRLVLSGPIVMGLHALLHAASKGGVQTHCPSVTLFVWGIGSVMI